MGQLRPIVLSIAGLDPSSGAGLLADIKTFEALKVYGLSIPSCITYQHDSVFSKVEWLAPEKIKEQLDLLKERFKIRCIKIGLIENLHVLEQLLSYFNTSLPDCKIIWDPVLKASAGYTFHESPEPELIKHICKKIFLITPNLPEAIALSNSQDAFENAKNLSEWCHVYLKGGHSSEKKGHDFLFKKEGGIFSYNPKLKSVSDKHGSGCVLSAALTANLGKNETLHKACLKAKNYTATFLNSNTTLLGYHKL